VRVFISKQAASGGSAWGIINPQVGPGLKTKLEQGGMSKEEVIMARKENDEALQSERRTSSSSALRPNEPYARSSWLERPSELVQRFRDEIDRVFGEFGFGGNLKRPFGEGEWGSLWSPQVEVFEREGQLIVRADLPGLERDDIKVDIDEDNISIKGERKQEHEENREGFYRSERSYGRFYRNIPLPEGVDPESCTANFNNGVLEIKMAAPERQKRSRRTIEIAGESTRAKRAGA